MAYRRSGLRGKRQKGFPRPLDWGASGARYSHPLPLSPRMTGVSPPPPDRRLVARPQQLPLEPPLRGPPLSANAARRCSHSKHRGPDPRHGRGPSTPCKVLTYSNDLADLPNKTSKGRVYRSRAISG
uniref:Uncharacterized protein n=1 Tax=Musa acuminata subsp. malaccensis TaxID=214687 RepID=A0A804JHZ9_MUSAM